MKICYDQPQTVELPRAEPLSPRPGTTHSMGRQVSQWVATSRDFASRASSRASVHTLTRPRKSHSRGRLSIGQPTDFRHNSGYDGVDGVQSMLDDASVPVRRRRSFRPLELSIYVADGRLSPLPDFELDEWGEMPSKPTQAIVRNRDWRSDSLSSEPGPIAYTVQRKPVGSDSRRSSVYSTQSAQSRPPSGTMLTLPLLQEEPRSRAASIRSTTPSETHRRGTLSPPRILSRLPSPSRARAHTAPVRPPSLRRVKPDADVDVDEAIRELNTIVEERRADAYRSRNQSPAFTNRPPPSPSSHVPAIAPSLRMHVRSETLSDIGSAFSAPLVTKPLPAPPPPPLPTNVPRRLTLAPQSRFDGPLNSNPITPTTPIHHRLGAWLRRSLPATPTSATSKTSFYTSKPNTPRSSTSASTKPFYQCTMPPPLPPTSRPSTSGSLASSRSSRTIHHTRQTSAETATATLVASSTCPSTPSLTTSPLHSPHSSIHSIRSIKTPPSPPAPTTTSLTPKKPRRVPAPLTLLREKEILVEASLNSARSVASTRSSLSTMGAGGHRRSLKPPPSPNYGILRGMEIGARQEGVAQHLGMGVGVGVAF